MMDNIKSKQTAEDYVRTVFGEEWTKKEDWDYQDVFDAMEEYSEQQTLYLQKCVKDREEACEDAYSQIELLKENYDKQLCELKWLCDKMKSDKESENNSDKICIDFAERIIKKRMRPDGFGGWSYSSSNFSGIDSKDILKLFKKEQGL